MGPERRLPGHLAPRPVLSPTRITLENKGKIRPQLDLENAFSGASGGGSGSATQLSPVPVSDSKG
jgi:hypothetical protein